MRPRNYYDMDYRERRDWDDMERRRRDAEYERQRAEEEREAAQNEIARIRNRMIYASRHAGWELSELQEQNDYLRDTIEQLKGALLSSTKDTGEKWTEDEVNALARTE